MLTKKHQCAARIIKMLKIVTESKLEVPFKQKIGFAQDLIPRELMDLMYVLSANPDVVLQTKLIYIIKVTMALCILII